MSKPEAIIKVQKDIEKGEIIYLGGTQTSLIKEVASDLSNFSITKLNYRKILFRILRLVCFTNHDYEPNT